MFLVFTILTCSYQLPVYTYMSNKDMTYWAAGGAEFPSPAYIMSVFSIIRAITTKSMTPNLTLHLLWTALDCRFIRVQGGSVMVGEEVEVLNSA